LTIKASGNQYGKGRNLTKKLSRHIISEYQPENHSVSRRFRVAKLYLGPVDTRKEKSYPLDFNKTFETPSMLF
jgi:hypothetical protein